jgi:hypothetical protein
MTESPHAKLPTASSDAPDERKIVVGAGYRLPAAPAHVADRGSTSVGAGYRLPTERKPA